MAWLLIDNSNTRTKLALGDGRSLQDWRAVIRTAELDSGSLDEALDGIDFTGVAVASVVPAKAELISAHFDGKKPVHFLGWESPLGFGFGVDEPGQIGCDRIANAAALRENYGFPSIAVDFGTAVTFSALSPTGDFLGGAIAPGTDAMISYLSTRTAQLPSIALTEPASAIGRNTVEALQSGVVFGHRGMVQGILRAMIAEIGGNPKIVATGGGAPISAKAIPEINVVDPDLTLEGIRLIAARAF